MPKVASAWTNFTAGEISPLLMGRVDLAKYFNGCRTLQNFLIHTHGPASRRPGTRFIHETKISSRKSRLIPFVFSALQGYDLEFGHNYIRFYQNGGIVVTAPDTPYELTTTYTEDELADLRWVQSADVMWIVHPNHAPRRLSRLGHTNWTLADVSFTAAPTAWAPTNGYPSCICFFEQRLIFASNKSNPQTIWGSKSANYTNFTPGVNDDDPIVYTICDNNIIQWVMGGAVLQIGTAGGEWKMAAATSGDPLTPTNVSVKQNSTCGSAKVQPQQVGDVVLFIQRHARILRELSYEWSKDSFVAQDLTILSEHITEPSLLQTAYQRTPGQVLWMVRSDGVLVGCTYERLQDVVAWHKHTTDGLFESVSVTPGDTQDRVTVIVNRTIGGVTKRYVEYFEDRNPRQAQKDCFYVDCGLTYDGDPATQISGLDHLEGKTVSILADGASVPDQVVTGGKITLATAASLVHIGLPFTSILSPVRPDAGAADGTSQGKVKRIHGVTIRMYQSLGLKVGPDLDNLDELEFRSASDLMGTPPSLFTGDKKVPFDGQYGPDGYVTVVQDKPLPCTILCILPQLTTMDDWVED